MSGPRRGASAPACSSRGNARRRRRRGSAWRHRRASASTSRCASRRTHAPECGRASPPSRVRPQGSACSPDSSATLACTSSTTSGSTISFGSDLIDRAQPLMEVRGRIDVRAPLADMRELLDLEPVLLDRIELNDGLIAEPLPMRRLRPERVRQIDEALAGEACIYLLQAWTLGLRRERRPGNQERASSAKHRGAVHIHVFLPIARLPMSRRWLRNARSLRLALVTYDTE